MIVQNKYGGESVDIVVSVTATCRKLQDLLRAVKSFWPSVAQISSFLWGLTVIFFVITLVTQSPCRADIWPWDFCPTVIWQFHPEHYLLKTQKDPLKCFTVFAWKISPSFFTAIDTNSIVNAFMGNVYIKLTICLTLPPSLQVSVYRHGEKIPEAKPTLTPKTIIPPKLPIEIPQPKTQPAPSPAPSAPSPAPPKSPAGRGVKSPTPTRRK